jgi:hypothetical protein
MTEIGELMITNGRGRIARDDLDFAYRRDISPGDLGKLTKSRDLGTVQPPRLRMKARHHRLAMLIASGEKVGVAANILGYAPATVSVLQQDPAFRNLVAVYRSQAEEKYQDLHKRAASLGESVLDELEDRLDQKPESFSISQLNEIAKNMLQHGAKPGASGGTGGVNFNINFVDSPEGAKVING